MSERALHLIPFVRADTLNTFLQLLTSRTFTSTSGPLPVLRFQYLYYLETSEQLQARLDSDSFKILSHEVYRILVTYYDLVVAGQPVEAQQLILTWKSSFRLPAVNSTRLVAQISDTPSFTLE